MMASRPVSGRNAMYLITAYLLASASYFVGTRSVTKSNGCSEQPRSSSEKEFIRGPFHHKCPSIARSKNFTQNVTEWFSVFGGDAKRHAHHHYLDDKSTVVEIGGYTGVDIKALRALYGNFHVLLFEPIFFREAAVNLQSLANIQIFPYGVGSVQRHEYFQLTGDATRPGKGDGARKAEIRNFLTVLSSLNVHRVDLLQVNCEGCEWEVLEVALKSPKLFRHIQVQFHSGAEWVPDRLDRYSRILDALSQTHTLIFDVPWVWQMWKLDS